MNEGMTKGMTDEDAMALLTLLLEYIRAYVIGEGMGELTSVTLHMVVGDLYDTVPVDMRQPVKAEVRALLGYEA